MRERYENPVLAEQYDLSEQDRSHCGDLEWYGAQLAGERGPVLELGAGTGRISLHLARLGVRVVALDLGLGMLQRLAAKRAALDSPDAVRPLCADAHALPLGPRARGRFPAVCSGYNALGCLIGRPAVLACFRAVHELLGDGQRFLFDVGAVEPGDLPREDADLGWQEWRSPAGRAIRRRTHVRPAADGSWMRRDYEYRWTEPDGRTGEARVHMDMNTWPTSAYPDLAREAGFELVEVDARRITRERRPRPFSWVYVVARRGPASGS